MFQIHLTSPAAFEGDPRIRNVLANTMRPYGDHFLVANEADLGETFRPWLYEAWRVGEEDHEKS